MFRVENDVIIRNGLPRFLGGERRLIQKPVGLHYTLVTGVVMFGDGNCANALPGKLLRSSQVAA